MGTDAYSIADIALVRYNDDRRRAVVGRQCRHGASWRKSSHPHLVSTPDAYA